MLGPATFPYLCPPLSRLSRIHTTTLDNGTDKRPSQQDEQLSCRVECGCVSFTAIGNRRIVRA
jgi:hypothetical protein